MYQMVQSIFRQMSEMRNEMKLLRNEKNVNDDRIEDATIEELGNLIDGMDDLEVDE